TSGASQVLTSNIAELANALQDPETIRAAQELAAGVVGALNQIIAGAKETVRIVMGGRGNCRGATRRGV
ncbi:hypothetical protein, partial [Pseudomonas aeruginosa]|uniref:hypothetical protein n=1 Tax=Pseudomonas aeruginosa TaxID=287 RepID=UPI0031B728E7